MHVRFQDTAEADLDAINDYLANKNQQGLERILTAIFTVAYQLESFPFLGREGEVEGTRELTIPRTEYRIVYTLDGPYFIDIIRILHAKLKYPPESN